MQKHGFIVINRIKPCFCIATVQAENIALCFRPAMWYSVKEFSTVYSAGIAEKKMPETGILDEERYVMGKKLLFIVNPKAGMGKIRQSILGITDIFTRHGYEVLLHPTQSAGDAIEKTIEYADQMDLIVCSGGDGTLDEVVTGLMLKESKTPIGYIPAGSTNDFANSLFMPKDPLLLAENIMQENIYRCDVGRFNNKTFAYVAAFGLFTDVSYNTPQDMKNILGHLAYVREGARKLFDIRSYPLRVRADDIEIEGDFIYGMVTNSRSVGGFKTLTHNVDMDDGLFEVTLIEMPKNPLELQQIVTALMMAEDNIDLIHSFKTGRITFEAEELIPWTLDGEYGGSYRLAEVENRHQALSLYLTSRHRKTPGQEE